MEPEETPSPPPVETQGGTVLVADNLEAGVGHGDDQVGSASLEILVDGSDLATIFPGSHKLEILVEIDRNEDDGDGHDNVNDHGEQVSQTVLANGVEVRVYMDGISRNAEEENAVDPFVAAEIQPYPVEPSCDTGLHPTENNHRNLDNETENSYGELNNDRKRPRESMEEVGRLLKPKNMLPQDPASSAILEENADVRTDVKPDDRPDSSVQFQLMGDGSYITGTSGDNNLQVPLDLQTTQSTTDVMDVGGIINRDSFDTTLQVTRSQAPKSMNCCDGTAEIMGPGNADSQGLIDEVLQEKNNKGGVTEDNGHVTNKEPVGELASRPRPKKKRKIAMLLAYCGAGYQGMQKNPGAVTIEGLLEEALTKAGAMPENYDGNPRKVDWARAARTDKGVSAVSQVVSGLFYVDPPGFVERVNAHLPKQVRLLGYKRVTPTFSAKKFCDRRRYEYVIPLFALDATRHRDRESVLASQGTEEALSKCQECSERGRKIPGAVGKGGGGSALENEVLEVANSDIVRTEGNIEVNVNRSKKEASLTDKAVEYFDDSACKPLAVIDPGQKQFIDEEMCAGLGVSSLNMERKSILGDKRVAESHTESLEKANGSSFHFGEAERMKLNRILSCYVGTHNFHNFTSRIKAEDPSAKRYIVSFQVGEVFKARNTEFVSCVVVGQSFMLHQIRKLIGFAIAIFRGYIPESMLHKALRNDTRVTIPTAPELGLFLDECMYPAYNQKWYNTHEEVSNKGFEKEIEEFKHEIIYEHIASTEEKEGQMALFLHTLNDRNYPEFASARETEATLADQQDVKKS